MKSKVAYLLTGILIGSLLFGSVAVFADQTIKLIVNGQVINSDVSPQIIDGRTMIPARALAEALGATVSWDASQNAVIVTSQGQKPATVSSGKSIDLTSLEYAGTNNASRLYIDKLKNMFTDRKFKIAGKEYDKGICLSGSYEEPYIAYNLQSNYSRLTGYFGTEDACPYNSSPYLNQVVIYGDDVKLYESEGLAKGDVPVFVDINVTGVNQLKIVFRDANPKHENIYVFSAVLANPKLYQ